MTCFYTAHTLIYALIIFIPSRHCIHHHCLCTHVPYNTFTLANGPRERVTSSTLNLNCMENPHAERHAVLLERILKNMVKKIVCTVPETQLTYPQSKCTETILELNRCVEVSNHLDSLSLYLIDTPSLKFHILKEILRANGTVKTAADLATKYRKNVQYNLEATKGS
jgi:DASH complex subunit DAD4